LVLHPTKNSHSLRFLAKSTDGAGAASAFFGNVGDKKGGIAGHAELPGCVEAKRPDIFDGQTLGPGRSHKVANHGVLAEHRDGGGDLGTRSDELEKNKFGNVEIALASKRIQPAVTLEIGFHRQIRRVQHRQGAVCHPGRVPKHEDRASVAFQKASQKTVIENVALHNMNLSFQVRLV
jgi:hypothetical protein